MSQHDVPPRPSSPWKGSGYQVRHRWQLDCATSLPEAVAVLGELAAELTAAHTAGWWLVEPMLSGRLVAARASRRQRVQRTPQHSSVATEASPAAQRWRLRLIQEPPLAGEEAFHSTAAAWTPVLSWTTRSLEQVSGPEVCVEVLSEIARQVASRDVAEGRWGVSTARVGPGLDLVADGSALRLHAVVDGALLRTREVLSFLHAADGAASLLQAAAAYVKLADEAEAMAAAGGRLTSSDDGFLDVDYAEATR